MHIISLGRLDVTAVPSTVGKYTYIGGSGRELNDLEPCPLLARSQQWVGTYFERKYLKEERLIQKVLKVKKLIATFKIQYLIIKKNTN